MDAAQVRLCSQSVTNTYRITIAESGKKREEMQSVTDKVVRAYIYIHIHGCIHIYIGGHSDEKLRSKSWRASGFSVHSLVAGCILSVESAFCYKFPCHLAAARSTSDRAQYDRDKRQRHSLALHLTTAARPDAPSPSFSLPVFAAHPRHLFHPPYHAVVTVREWRTRQVACTVRS